LTRRYQSGKVLPVGEINEREETHMSNIHHPGFPPHMASIVEENEWLVDYNRYHAALAADKGYAFYLKGVRIGSPSASIVWWIKDAATHRLIDCFEDRDEALKALDALEVK